MIVNYLPAEDYPIIRFELTKQEVQDLYNVLVRLKLDNEATKTIFSELFKRGYREKPS